MRSNSARSPSDSAVNPVSYTTETRLKCWNKIHLFRPRIWLSYLLKVYSLMDIYFGLTLRGIVVSIRKLKLINRLLLIVSDRRDSRLNVQKISQRSLFLTVIINYIITISLKFFNGTMGLAKFVNFQRAILFSIRQLL